MRFSVKKIVALVAFVGILLSLAANRLATVHEFNEIAPQFEKELHSVIRNQIISNPDEREPLFGRSGCNPAALFTLGRCKLNFLGNSYHIVGTCYSSTILNGTPEITILCRPGKKIAN